MRPRRGAFVCVCMVVVLLLAGPAIAQPADGGMTWWAWLAEGWNAVVRVLAGSEEPGEEPEATAAEPEGEPEAVTECLPLAGCTEVDGGPSLDPNGDP